MLLFGGFLYNNLKTSNIGVENDGKLLHIPLIKLKTRFQFNIDRICGD